MGYVYYLELSEGGVHDPRRSAINYRKTNLASCEAPSQNFVRELNSGVGACTWRVSVPFWGV